MTDPASPATSDFASKVETASVVEALTERLESAIVTGMLPAGSRLSEQALATRFGVSRGPLREALRSLEGRGLIERKHNIGARVASLSAKDLEELLTVRAALEGAAARLAAERMTDEEIAGLLAFTDRALSDQQVPATELPSLFENRDDGDFHLRIIRGSRNERLIKLLTGDTFYLFRIYRFRSSVLPGRVVQAALEHRSIATSIAARDAEGAEKAMRHHLARSHENMLRNLQSVIARPAAQPDERVYADGRQFRHRKDKPGG